MKPKKDKFPYKFIRPDQLDELKRKTDENLLKDHLFESRAILIVNKQKKDDATLKDLKDQVKKHRDADEDLKKAKEQVKQAREACDEEIKETIEDKKALESGYREQAGTHKELVKAIQIILEDRKINRPS